MTAEPMTIDRFRALADAYGGVIARWPGDVAAEARRLSLTAEGGAILADALALDEALDEWRVPAPGAALAGLIVAGAPGPSLARRARLLWAGFGVAAALSGATAGVAATVVLAPANHAESTTVFGNLPAGSDDRG